MKKALVTETRFSEEHEARLKKAGVQIKYAHGDLKEDELIKELQGCQIYVIGGSDKATKKVIESTNLELIIFWGTGYESYIDIPTAKSKNIKTANTPHANAYTVAEHTVALILDAVKNITFINNQIKRGEWKRRETWNLEERTLGIIGMGHIGSDVARIMHNGFKMKILYFSRSSKAEIEKELGAKKVALDIIFKKSDVVSIHTPLTSETEEIVGKKELQDMRKHSILVNPTRAELVDSVALKEVLEAGLISCAAFDTYYEEPAPKPENDKYGLLSLSDKKFLVTSHTAYGSHEAVEKTNEMVVENIENYLKNGEPTYEV